MHIKVSVRTNSKKEFIKEEKNNQLLVAVKAPALRGLANEAVLNQLRTYFGAGKIIKIVSGHHSPHKIISVEHTL